MATRIALLGTGKMGAALGRRLAGAGFELTLWDRTAERATAVGAGRVAATPAEAVVEAEFVVSSPPDLTLSVRHSSGRRAPSKRAATSSSSR